MVAVESDAAQVADTQRVIDLAVERFGRVDILVDNAAVFQSCLSPETTEDLWDFTCTCPRACPRTSAASASPSMAPKPPLTTRTGWPPPYGPPRTGQSDDPRRYVPPPGASGSLLRANTHFDGTGASGPAPIALAGIRPTRQRDRRRRWGISVPAQARSSSRRCAAVGGGRLA